MTINVTDIDEKPTFATSQHADGVLNALGCRAIWKAGRLPIRMMTLLMDSSEPATLVASDPDGEESYPVADGRRCGLRSSLLTIRILETMSAKVLSFMEKPDFEMPGDRNRDNVYEVTVRASDGTMHADRMLIIKVINNAGEGGKVTLSPEDAVVGVELTATLTHMEGGVAASGQITNPMWQWQRADVPTALVRLVLMSLNRTGTDIDNANAKKDYLHTCV